MHLRHQSYTCTRTTQVYVIGSKPILLHSLDFFKELVMLGNLLGNPLIMMYINAIVYCCFDRRETQFTSLHRDLHALWPYTHRISHKKRANRLDPPLSPRLNQRQESIWSGALYSTVLLTATRTRGLILLNPLYNICNPQLMKKRSQLMKHQQPQLRKTYRPKLPQPHPRTSQPHI
jgi:hypothetical protein